ncbi:putative hydrolase, alpha/beta fold family [Aspergillus clavatus NRRL 1]|uniref:alcohol O-acetyltransferase n=1 Tax=Aspergillus clavatus (strain ATCC 1007 / CBS 513.65 / DSM 816 / NCTC 3887 / NRRL 1 / QM 1276 / 107) TaxID=344612 RepID=A1CM72_ASPCL|nr:alpha/beta fold family hydrolase, putative [Aspergillus clavatus NRRL 1]EAW08659.1 alpha/beta fold family hydrolase, putative [Aspergillus clavatus NRRL 1]
MPLRFNDCLVRIVIVTLTDLVHSILYSSLLPLVISGVLVIAMLSWIRPSARLSFFHSKDNKLLLTKKSGESGVKEQVTLTDVCRASTPAKCHLNPLLFNGHLQTAWTVAQFDDVPVYYKRKMFDADSAMLKGHFAVDFVVEPYEMPKNECEITDKARQYTLPSGLPERTTFFTEEEFKALPSDDTKPMLVLLHGLSGGSHEIYLRHVLAPLIADGSWEACVVNSRGCSQTKISTGVLYNARATWDVRQAVKWLRQAFPNRPLFGIGFSLGANILANYLGEEGDACQLKAAVLCASPWNLPVSSANLQRTWLGLEVYSKTMGTSMKRLFEQHVEQVSKNPRVDVEAVRKSKYLHEFDRALQCAAWGYPTEGAYYRDAASIDSMLAIRIPFFTVQAEDDPIASVDALPFQEMAQTPYGVMLTTSWGGHLGWFELGGDRWFVKPVTKFLNTMAKEIDLATPFVVEHPEKLPGQIANHFDPSKDPDMAPKPDFNPMRRKLALDVRQ